MLALLKKVPGLSESERALFAVSLSSSPDERWLRMTTFLQLHSSSASYSRKTSGF